VRPCAVAVALENAAAPKLASANVVQPPPPSHVDGASTIHSALETSGFEWCRVVP
jgi:hypothetical protein